MLKILENMKQFVSLNRVLTKGLMPNDVSPKEINEIIMRLIKKSLVSIE